MFAPFSSRFGRVPAKRVFDVVVAEEFVILIPSDLYAETFGRQRKNRLVAEA